MGVSKKPGLVSGKPKAVIVHYYVIDAVYLDGKLLFYAERPSPGQVFRELGHPVEYLNVDWHYMPGFTENSEKRPLTAYTPPERLSAISDHLAVVTMNKKKARLAQLREELKELEAECGA